MQFVSVFSKAIVLCGGYLINCSNDVLISRQQLLTFNLKEPEVMQSLTSVA